MKASTVTTNHAEPKDLDFVAQVDPTNPNSPTTRTNPIRFIDWPASEFPMGDRQDGTRGPIRL